MNIDTATLHRRTLESPIGEIEVLANPESGGGAIVAILWDTTAAIGEGQAHNPVDARHDGRTVIDDAPGAHAMLDTAVTQLGEYFSGHRVEFDLVLAPAGTQFQRQAWDALRQIPFGETISYGQQAATLGDVNKARAVGAANGQNPIPIVVPCHRVIGGNGKLTGFAGGLNVKAWLLEHERLTLLGSGAAGV